MDRRIYKKDEGMKKAHHEDTIEMEHAPGYNDYGQTDKQDVLPPHVSGPLVSTLAKIQESVAKYAASRIHRGWKKLPQAGNYKVGKPTKTTAYIAQMDSEYIMKSVDDQFTAMLKDTSPNDRSQRS